MSEAVGFSDFVVVKFGGTSVANLDCWLNITTILQQHIKANKRPVLVCSAPSRVSSYLQELLDLSTGGEDTAPLLSDIKQIYQVLAAELEVPWSSSLGEVWDDLEHVVAGIALLKQHSPKIRAKLMAFGELLLTQLATDYLKQQQLTTTWLDAREYLQAPHQLQQHYAQSYVNALCHIERDPSLIKEFKKIKSAVIITQGFIASNEAGETVLLGRGGSDISAAYFAAKLGAGVCEIWTDVPGIYTANPHVIAEARHLIELTYEEAQEIALMGAKVLHPRTIMPLQQQKIPLMIRYTKSPQREGTLIQAYTNTAPAMKAVLIKNDVMLISIEAFRMWQQAGFLATIFACFKRHNISIDLISTSECNVTVSLDVAAEAIDQQSVKSLMQDLSEIAQVKAIGPCATISVIGCKIRTILHQLSGFFNVLRSEKVHLVSQAANDLNFSVVVEQAQAERIAKVIHNQIIEQSINHECFGLSYDQEFVVATTRNKSWWEDHVPSLLKLAQESTPVYVYSEKQLQRSAQSLLECDALDQVFYAMKANSHEGILQILYNAGLGFECVSIYEVERVFALFPTINPHKIIFTPNFAAKTEYQQAIELGVYVTIDNLHPLINWPELFKNRDILLRIDPGFGKGHHQYVETGGSRSKFGIPHAELEQAQQLIKACGARVIGLHAHSGSGILQANNWAILAEQLTLLGKLFPSVKMLNLGGGLGIPESHKQNKLDLEQFNQALLQIKSSHPKIQLWLEPGRFLTAEAGVLLARVNQVKKKASINYIGVDAGMHTLIRPALYGSYHPIVNLTRINNPADQLAHVVGPICESGDVLGYSRWMPETREGDILLIDKVGAYGASMSSNYNLRPLAQEVVFKA